MIVCKSLKIKMKKEKDFDKFLNNVHKIIKIKNLNDVRLNILNSINSSSEFL